MKKFDYIKWVIKNKYGLLNEQIDVEKNKPQPIKDKEPLTAPAEPATVTPTGVQTPSGHLPITTHNAIEFEICSSDGLYPVGHIMTSTSYNSTTGWACNNTTCTDTGGPNGTGDIGEIFTYTTNGGHQLIFKLLQIINPVNGGIGVNINSSTCPGSTPQYNSHEKIVFAICDSTNMPCVTYPGGNFTAYNIGLQCNGAMCTDTGGPNGTGDIGETFKHVYGANTFYGTIVSLHDPFLATNPQQFTSDVCPDLGCTDVEACNYQQHVCPNNSMCDYSCYGCTDANYANYDPSATIDDGSCSDCTLSDSELYDYLTHTVPYNNMFNAGQLGQDVTIAHFCEKCNEYMNQQGPSPSTPFDEHCVCCTYQDAPCEGFGVSEFNSWPISSTQGCTEFDAMYGPIPPNPPVNSQWVLNNGYSLGGCSLYYPSQAAFCEMCEGMDAFAQGGHPIQQYSPGNPAAAGYSPVGSPYWLVHHDACGCCAGIGLG